MKDEILIQEYSKSEIVLNNKQIIKGSNILVDDGKFFPIKIENSIEQFLNEEKNYTFLQSFKDKEIFLVGCGKDFVIPSIKIRKIIHDMGLKLEWVTTPMALQIFNMLVEDKRSCCSLLINEI